MDYYGAWTWEEFYIANTQLNAMLDSVSHQVHCIVNAEASGSVPMGAVSRFGSLTKTMRANLGRFIVVGANRYIQAVFRMVGAVAGSRSRFRFAFVNTVEEACALLAERTISDA